jgi:hypothetical protein
LTLSERAVRHTPLGEAWSQPRPVAAPLFAPHLAHAAKVCRAPSMLCASRGDMQPRRPRRPSQGARSVAAMTEHDPMSSAAGADRPAFPAMPPDQALVGLTATWQAILRERHPDHGGLVVEVLRAPAEPTSARGGTAGEPRTRRAA